MAGYGETFKNLSSWTFERKLALEQDLQADRLKKELEERIKDQRAYIRHKHAAAAAPTRLVFDAKLDQLDAFRERLDEEDDEDKREWELAQQRRASMISSMGSRRRLMQIAESSPQKRMSAAQKDAAGEEVGRARVASEEYDDEDEFEKESEGPVGGIGGYDDDEFEASEGGDGDKDAYDDGFEDEDEDNDEDVKSGDRAGDRRAPSSSSKGAAGTDSFEEESVGGGTNAGGESVVSDKFEEESLGGGQQSAAGGGSSDKFEEESVGGGAESSLGQGDDRFEEESIGGGAASSVGKGEESFEEESIGGGTKSASARSASLGGDAGISEGGGGYEDNFEDDEDEEEGGYGDDDGFEEDEEDDDLLEQMLKKKDAEAVEKRAKMMGMESEMTGVIRPETPPRTRQLLLPGEERRGDDAMTNPFHAGGLEAAADAVVKESRAAEDKILELAEYDAIGGRAEWAQDPLRSNWGIGEQGDRVDAYGHRGTGPYEVSYSEGWTDVVVSNLDWGVSEEDLSAAFGMVGGLNGCTVARFVEPGWRHGEAKGLRRCVGFVSFGDAADAKRALLQMNGRGLKVSKGYVMVEGEPMAERKQHGGVDDGGGVEGGMADEFPMRGTAGFLAAIQLFWAVRDGNVGAAKRALDSGGVSAGVGIVTWEFPEGSKGKVDGGRPWPKESYDGGRGDTPLHLAARYKHLEMVEMLLSRGANPAVPNKDGKLPDECIGVLEVRGKRQDGGGRGGGGDEGDVDEGDAVDEDEDEDEDEEGGVKDYGGDEDDIYDLLCPDDDGKHKDIDSDEDDEAGRVSLVSKRLAIVPAMSATVAPDGTVVMVGVPTVSMIETPEEPPPPVWAGGAWKKVQRSNIVHERCGARYNGAGAAGRVNMGHLAPGPGYYRLREAWDRQRDVTSALAPGGHRHPRGFTWGAGKMGKGSYTHSVVRFGKGTQTKGAGIGTGRAVEVGKQPIVSKLNGQNFATVFAHEGGAKEEAKRKTPFSGAFSRTPGSSHLPAIDMHIPGPQAYTPSAERPAPTTVFATAERRMQGVVDDVACVEGLYLGRRSDYPGPGEYDIPGEHGLWDGNQGHTFPQDEYASRYYFTEMVTESGPGPAAYNVSATAGDKVDPGWSFGHAPQREEIFKAGPGGPDWPGPGEYALPPLRGLYDTNDGPSFPTAEYAERYYDVGLGNGEGMVGPGSYDVGGGCGATTGWAAHGPAWTIGWEKRLAGDVVRGEYRVSVDCE